MECIVRAFPVLDGQLPTLLEFSNELRERGAETRGFYRKFGVFRETWHVQTTPTGSLVICITELEERKTAKDIGSAYASSAEDFDAWFKRRVLEMTGIDPDKEPLGPPTECVFDTHTLSTGADSATA